MTYLESAPHEFGANFQFVDHGITPFVAFDELVTDAGDSCSSVFKFEEETWTITLEPRDSGLRDPGDQLPTGTPFPMDGIREFSLWIESEEDPVGQRSAYAHVRPRWQGMESEQDSDPSVPRTIDEGVNIKMEGSNIEFDRYRPLLQTAVTALGLSSDYFESVHETSTVYQAEQYVRVHKDHQGSLISRDGPLMQLLQLLLNDREGGQRVDLVDTDGRGQNVPGYYVTVPLGSTSQTDVFPGHEHPMVIKFYHSRETEALDPGESLAHPKLTARYSSDGHSERAPATQDGLAKLKREQDEKLLSLLGTAGLPLRSEFGCYVADAYFEPVASERDLAVVELDLGQARDTQEALVIKYMSGGLSPVEREALEVLVTDGGEVSPQDIAKQTDRNVGSVRRALGRIPGLVERSYGQVALRSRNVATLVHEALVQAGERLRKAPSDAGERAKRQRDDEKSALFRWLETRGIELTNSGTGGSLVLDFGSEPRPLNEIHRIIREGLDKWTDAGRPEKTYRTATLRFKKEVAGGSTYLTDSALPVSTGKVWRYLP